MTWKEVEAFLRDRAYATIENQPEFLLEHDGGPPGVKADMIYARLIGFDDEIVADWRTEGVRDVLLMPIPRRMNVAAHSDTSPPDLTIRTAKFVLQSNYVEHAIQPLMYCNDGPSPTSDDFLVRLLFLRYRRRE